MRVFDIAGHSGMGKTTLLESILPELQARGLTVSLIKHSHKTRILTTPIKTHTGCAKQAAKNSCY
jgi:molybdopterin-guanine dinucleotide biosynthesis protein B